MASGQAKWMQEAGVRSGFPKGPISITITLYKLRNRLRLIEFDNSIILMMMTVVVVMMLLLMMMMLLMLMMMKMMTMTC